MKNILKTVASYTAIGALAILMGTATIGCKETVQGPAGAPGASGANGAPGAQGDAAPANPAMSEKSDKSTTTTTTANDVPGTGSSTTTQKSSTKTTN
jgi:hypothetical protein